MKHTTYELFKQAHMGHVDEIALRKAMENETDPFIIQAITFILEKPTVPVSWDTTPFTKNFRSAEPRQRMDETVITFLLRIAAIVKEECYVRVFRKPETFTASLAWIQILEQCIYTVLTLLYNVTWKSTDFFKMNEVIMDLLYHGEATALRDFMQYLGISLASKHYPAEKMFEKLNYMHTGQFGSFYWRLLHWMAEAVNVRSNRPEEKNMWRELVTGPLYRTLRCGICMFHLKSMTNQLHGQLMDDSQDYAKLWFDIHNQVHAKRREQFSFLNEPDYSEEDYQLDAEFMQQALR